ELWKEEGAIPRVPSILREVERVAAGLHGEVWIREVVATRTGRGDAVKIHRMQVGILEELRLVDVVRECHRPCLAAVGAACESDALGTVSVHVVIVVLQEEVCVLEADEDLAAAIPRPKALVGRPAAEAA